ncbi:TPA: TrmH family RNA methyltransferase [Candidatus Nomurabacteria bacterium]|nr:MAG: tRNA/rRNA methyltransferase SpoU [Parcubacteria bacterium RAAC4_OD1_1]HCY26163.1 TrmH family RNA methyltransferase [Candidatus Nomurabacteria bacterium]
MNKNNKLKVLILPNIRSAINVGAIFRTADALGIDMVYLVGVTPRPTDKFGRIQKDIKKSALGAEEFVKWEYKEKLLPLLNKLRKDNYFIVAIEQGKNSKDYRKIKIKEKTAFILGEEVYGIKENILDKCDAIAEIPMHGKKESLNVSVACGVALFRMMYL